MPHKEIRKHHMSDPPLPNFDSIEDAIQDFRNGRFIVVLDSEDRENEGDLIIAAEHVTKRDIAFMVTHTTGILCTPMSRALTQSFELPQMVDDNTESHQTAFTISVDAAHPAMTTGASAHDRALTCRTLASPKATAQSFKRPGHIFPLRARKGGVRERKGHTEAAVDFCRLAGLREVAVISELVKQGPEYGFASEDWGDMMRRDDCLAFGAAQNLKVCTIEALVQYLETEKAQ